MYENSDIDSKINQAIASADEFFEKNKDVISSQAESWFRHNGVLNEVVLNKIVLYLLLSIKGLKDLSIDIDNNNKKIRLYFALNWFSFIFRKKKTLRKWGMFLSSYFPTHDIDIFLHKYKLGWENDINRKSDNNGGQDKEKEKARIGEIIRKKAGSGSKKSK